MPNLLISFEFIVVIAILVISAIYNFFFWNRVGQIKKSLNMKIPQSIFIFLQIGTIVLIGTALIFAVYIFIKPF